jgi:hypothetical protein
VEHLEETERVGGEWGEAISWDVVVDGANTAGRLPACARHRVDEQGPPGWLVERGLVPVAVRRPQLVVVPLPIDRNLP